MANINDDTAPYQPTGTTDAVTGRPDPVAAGGPRGAHGARPRHVSSGGNGRRHATPLTLALALWVAALAVGMTAGALTDSPPAGEDDERAETAVGGLQDLPATASTTLPTTPPPTTGQPTSLPPTTAAPPPPEDSDDSEDSEGSGEGGDSDTARCDAAQAAADQARAAVDGVHETLLDLAEAERAAADAETQAEQACSGGED